MNKIIFINANSLVSRCKRYYLQEFLHLHRPDALLVAETKLAPLHKLGFAGYEIFRQNRVGGRGGGTAVFVRNTLVSDRISLNLGSIENTAVRVKKADGSYMVLLSMYLRPQDTLSLADLEPLDNLALSNEVIVGADLNAKHSQWGGNAINDSGRVLHDFLVGCGHLSITPTLEPTRVSGTSRSYIDLFITSPSLSNYGGSMVQIKTLDYESDHKAVMLQLATTEMERRAIEKRLDFERLNASKLNSKLEALLPVYELPIDRNASVDEIDTCIDNMDDVFSLAMDHSAPKIEIGGRGLLHLPPHIRKFIRMRKQLRRALERTEDYGRHSTLKATIWNLGRIIQGQIKSLENQHWANKLTNLKLDPNFYRNVKSICGIRAKKHIPDFAGSDGHLIYDDLGKSNFLAESFENVHRANDGIGFSEWEERVDRDVDSLVNAPLVNFGLDVDADGSTPFQSSQERVERFITPEEIGVALKSFNNKKSSGPDGVPNIVLRKVSRVAWRFLAILFNQCINNGYFPLAWKQAIVVPVPKPGSTPTAGNGYRPISLLSCIGKLFEYFILLRINEKINSLAIIRDIQFGFRHGHSTSHCLMVLTDYIARAAANRKATIAVSLDFAKAFDTAWQNGIVWKMIEHGFDQHICCLIKSFLSDRTFKVRVGRYLSEQRVVSAGVPQGSLLGPVLYNIFLSDLPSPNRGDLSLVYADDILIASCKPQSRNSNRSLVEHLQTLAEFFQKWKLKLNVEKCRAIIFKGERSHLYENSRKFKPNIAIGGQTIPNVVSMKYLGVWFSESLRFTEHIDYILAKSKSIYFAWQGAIGGRSGLSAKVKLLIYKQVIRPVMAYAFPIWFGISSAQMERIRLWERKMLRSCLGIRREQGSDGVYRLPPNQQLYDQIGFKRVDAFLIDSALKFLGKAPNIGNGLVDACFDDLSSIDRHRRLLPPAVLVQLEEENLLVGGDEYIFYHRRYRTFDISDLVYSTSQ